MLMFRMTAHTTGFRRLIGWMLTAACCVLAVGLAGAAVVRVEAEEPGVRFLSTRSAPTFEAPLAAARTTVIEQDPVKPAGATEAADRADAVLTEADERTTRPASATVAPAFTGRVIQMEVTAYCPCPRCCGAYADAITASGKPVSYNNSRFVAADTRLLPFNTQLIIPGYNYDQPVEVQDRGGAIKGNKLDLFFPTHQEALNWGRRHLLVTVLD
jgi:3D (Asp-Asp-Asp) domain-containing protein